MHNVLSVNLPSWLKPAAYPTQELCLSILRMMTDRLPFEPKERSEPWTNRAFGGSCQTILHFLTALRIWAKPTKPTDFHPANVTVEELRASNRLLALVSLAPAESPDEVITMGACVQKWSFRLP
jgi:hypothetical protein